MKETSFRARRALALAGLVVALLSGPAAGGAAPPAAGPRLRPARPMPQPGATLGSINWNSAVRGLDGKRTSLAAFKGKVLFVNFWASWCAPCIAEMPSIERLRASLAGRPVEFLLVSLDQRDADVERFLSRHELGLPVWFPAWEPGTSGFAGSAVPITYIVAPDGRIAYRHQGAVDWDTDAVRALIERLAPKPSSGA